jgi:N-acetylmuramoyl-L-alanine amidase
MMGAAPSLAHAASRPAAQVVVHVATYDAVTTVRLLNLRTAPSLQARVLLRLPDGALLHVHGYTAHWLQVTTPSGVAGYVFGKDVRALPLRRPVPVAFAAPFLVVGVQAANLRAAPSLTARVVLVLRSGATVSLHRESGSWAYVSTRSGVAGWMWRSLLRTA